jgi:magnesium chelatase family protein
MLARRLTTILPAMNLAGVLEPTRLHRVAGLTGDRPAVVTAHPCRAPPQTISAMGLIGGGQVPMSGDGSLASRGGMTPTYGHDAYRPHASSAIARPIIA